LRHKQQNQQALPGYLFAIGATALWSGNFIIARGLNESIPPISLAFWRWVVAVIVFLPFALKPLIAQRDVLKEHISYLAITAFLGITTFNTLIYLAGHTTTALNLSRLHYHPVQAIFWRTDNHKHGDWHYSCGNRCCPAGYSGKRCQPGQYNFCHR
jgi:hypothetical protein